MFRTIRIAVAVFALSAATGARAGEAHAPLKLLWGDTHLHTSHSVDAWSTGNTLGDPETAYRFAKGEWVLHPTARTRIRIDRPLDFLVVADHAEMLELQVRLARKDPLLLATESGQRLAGYLSTEPARIFQEVMRTGSNAASPLYRELQTEASRRVSWSEHVDAAEKHNQPGKFTALIGWEWSSGPGGLNLHRVVFTPSDGATAKKFLPYGYFDSERPEDLWRWLDKTSAETGAEFIALPHNSNLSNGLMFDLVDSDGRPMSAEYARTRARWEPVVEVTQVKGTSETHPALSPGDEYAAFEIRNKLLGGGPAKPAEGSYVRSALLRGLAIENRTGVNPYRFGLIGSTDSHTGLSSTDETNFYGKVGADMLPEQRMKPGVNFAAWEMSASGLAAVWATENTRRGIADAFRRKEVYATSGTRIALQVYAGFGFRDADARAHDIGAVGHARGVAMGGEIARAPRGRAPTLLIHAARDPRSAALDRLQVVKGWLDAQGERHERVFDARIAPPEGDGATQLATVWRDPQFDPSLRAFYYVRVIERPVPRHQVYDAQALGIDPRSTGQPLTIQERAWSSPIWYTP